MRKSKIESDDPGPTVGDANKVNASSTVSSCEQTKSDVLSSTSTTANSTEEDQKDQNNLDEVTMSVGPKGSDKISSNIKTYLDNLYDRINVQVSGFLVDGKNGKNQAQ